MNEPALFLVDSKTMPDNTPHRADPELGGQSDHVWMHNVYGMLMSKSTKEGMCRAFGKGKRPFVLTRASFIGGQLLHLPYER